MTKPEWPKELTGTITVWPYNSTTITSQGQPETTLATVRKRNALGAGSKPETIHHDSLPGAERGSKDWREMRAMIIKSLVPLQEWLIAAANQTREVLSDFSDTLEIINAIIE